MGRSPLGAGGPRRSLNGKQLRNTATGTPLWWGSRLIVGRASPKPRWKPWPPRRWSWGIRRSSLISRASFLIQLKSSAIWLPGAPLRPHRATQKARGIMTTLPAIAPRPSLQPRRDLGFLSRLNPYLHQIFWQATAPQTTPRRGALFYRKIYKKVLFASRALTVRRQELCTVPDKKPTAHSAFSCSPFVGGRRSSMLGWVYRSSLRRIFPPELPPIFTTSQETAPLKNRAIMKLRHPKEMSLQNKTQMFRWPSSSFCA